MSYEVITLIAVIVLMLPLVPLFVDLLKFTMGLTLLIGGVMMPFVILWCLLEGGLGV